MRASSMPASQRPSPSARHRSPPGSGGSPGHNSETREAFAAKLRRAEQDMRERKTRQSCVEMERMDVDAREVFGGMPMLAASSSRSTVTGLPAGAAPPPFGLSQEDVVMMNESENVVRPVVSCEIVCQLIARRAHSSQRRRLLRRITSMSTFPTRTPMRPHRPHLQPALAVNYGNGRDRARVRAVIEAARECEVHPPALDLA